MSSALTLTAAVLVGASLAGCRFFPVCWGTAETCECVCGNDLSWMSPVTIIPVCGDERNDPILMSFCQELATALHHRGVPDVVIRGTCDRRCEANPQAPVNCPETEPGAPPSHLMFVTLPDVRPYRPMRMTVDLRVVHSVDQREVARVVEVYEGPQESPLRESPRQFRLFREVEREERADREAYTAFLSNSPRVFLTDSARRVIDRLSFTGLPPVPVEPTPDLSTPPDAPGFVPATETEADPGRAAITL
ncbi:MAG: hypothetical protein AB7I48_01675 [Planctomycetaceae bacterium]